jgi:hypothetical protein
VVQHVNTLTHAACDHHIDLSSRPHRSFVPSVTDALAGEQGFDVEAFAQEQFKAYMSKQAHT